MYIARFSYSIKPVDRERALALLGQEVEAARGQGLEARLLVPLTRPQGGPALQYELVLPNLDEFADAPCACRAPSSCTCSCGCPHPGWTNEPCGKRLRRL